MSKGGKKKRSTAGLILDVILTLCTGGLYQGHLSTGNRAQRYL